MDDVLDVLEAEAEAIEQQLALPTPASAALKRIDTQHRTKPPGQEGADDQMRSLNEPPQSSLQPTQERSPPAQQPPEVRPILRGLGFLGGWANL